MSRARARWIALGVSSAVALGGGWLAWRALFRPKSGTVRVQVLPREDVPEYVRRPPEARGFEISDDPRDPRAWRYFMNERQAGRFHPVGSSSEQVYDPWVYCRDAGNLTIEMPWAEHPDGKFVWRSNSLGCREDHELAVPPAARRVLVAGDSHTSGVCNDSESFANRLEALLAAQDPSSAVEVLNAGLGGYSFYNYLGTLLRLSEFEPQVLVVAVYGGNDFLEVLPLYLRFHGLPWRQLTAEEEARRGAALELAPDAMGQGFASADAFRNWPESSEIALRAARELCAEIRSTAERRGARTIVAYLPCPFELPGGAGDERLRSLQELLALGPQDLRRWADQGDAFLRGLREEGIEAVDLRPVFAAEPAPPYWKGDFHLDLRGHELAARALEPAVRAALERR